jgi:filamentous hemagglutinin family protein
MRQTQTPCRNLLVVGLFCAIGLSPTAAHAQMATSITSDGTLPTPTSVADPVVIPTGNLYNIDGGTIITNGGGVNQFHSFGTFSVGTGDAASFNDSTAAGVDNIISRVTGGVTSGIDGTITTTIPGANLYLLNPAGVMFGPNSQLAVDGSFHVSTADYLKLGETGTFYVDPGQASTLTAAPPSAFGFLNPDPASVQALTSNLLIAPEGETLSLVAGGVEVGAADGSLPGFLLASQGRINLVSVASPGEVAFDGAEINVDSFDAMGDVKIGPGSIVDAREVYIRGGRLEITNAYVSPGVFTFAGLGTAPNGGEVNVLVSDDIEITGQSLVFGLFTPGIRTRAGSETEMTTPTDVPDIRLQAGGEISVSGLAAVQSDRFGPGEAATIDVTADTVTVSNGASMSVNNLFAGAGGSLIVTARVVDLGMDPGQPIANTAFMGLAAQSAFHPGYANPEYVDSAFPVDGAFNPDLTTADGGSIFVTATERLTVSDGAEISTDSFGFGKSGAINLQVGDLVLSKDGADTGKIAAQSALAGDAGNIDIHATGSIDISDGFQISASTFGSGSGGAITVSADQGIQISGQSSGIFSGTAPPTMQLLDEFAGRIGFPSFDALRNALGMPDGDFYDVLGFLNVIPAVPGETFTVTSVPDLTPGDGGQISVTASSLDMSGDARITSSTLWDANAGAVDAQFGTLTLSDGAAIRSQSGGVRGSDILVGAGNAGSISLSVDEAMTITGKSTSSGIGSNVSTSTFGEGDAGQVFLQTGETVLSAGGRIRSESGGTLGGEQRVGSGAGGTVSVGASGNIEISGSGSAVSTSTAGEGAGGDIELQATNVYLTGGGTVSAESTGTEASLGAGAQPGDAGDITITAAQDFENIGGSVTTEAVEADGGDIKITAGGTVYLLGGDITTSVLGAGGTGGNIDIDPEFVIIQGGSNVLANAKNPLATQAGNIYITGNYILISQDSLVEATGPSNDKNGEIILRGPDGELSRSLAQLPESYLDAAGLLKGGCGAAQAGLSSLVLAGRGGVPAQPTGYVPSYDLAAFGLSGQDVVARADMRNMLVALGPKDPTATGWLLAERGCR